MSLAAVTVFSRPRRSARKYGPEGIAGRVAYKGMLKEIVVPICPRTTGRHGLCARAATIAELQMLRLLKLLMLVCVKPWRMMWKYR